MPRESYPEIPPEEFVCDDYTEALYNPITGRKGVTFHVLRGSCSSHVERPIGEDGPCKNNAAVRKVTDSGIEDRCLKHVPEEWLETLDGNRQVADTFIDLRAQCSHTVIRGAGMKDLDPTEREVGDGDSGPCENGGLITITDEKDWAKTFCRMHTRELWLDGIEFQRGMSQFENGEGKIDPETEPLDDMIFYDPKLGTTFPDYDRWREAANGEYPDIMQAEANVVPIRAETAVLKA